MAVRDPLEPAAQTRALNLALNLSASFEAILGHDFKRPDLLREALTHRSAAQGHGGHGQKKHGARASNERLEFVGDRVLGLTMAEWLAERFPREQEGELGRRLAYLVSQPVLAGVADAVGLAAALSVSPGEAKAGVAKRATVLADALEAALGALYLDGGLEVAREFVRRAWNDAMIEQAEPPKDPKTALQEWAQKRGKDLPIYEVTGRSGPPHAPAFTVKVTVGPTDATGIAGNKRVAEQLAAEALLTRLPA
jgi:ribonuclease-3